MHYVEGHQAYYTLKDMLDYNTDKHKERTALQFVDGTQKYTYGELKQKVDWLAARLAECGMGVGEKAIILAENMPNWVVAFLALTTSGRVAVPMTTKLTETELEGLVRHSDSKVAFVSEKMMGKLTDNLKAELDTIIRLDTLDFIKVPADAQPATKIKAVSSGDLAAIIYTSGSSGRTKGVMLSHRNLCQSIWSMSFSYLLDSYSCCLSILPLFHIYELTIGCLYVLSVGAKIFYFQQSLTPGNLLPVLKQVRPTYFCCVPLVVEMLFGISARSLLASHPMMVKLKQSAPNLFYRLVAGRFKRLIGKKCRCLGIGGSKLSSEIEKCLLKAHVPYFIGYGMTETAPLILYTIGKYRSVGSAGIAAHGVNVRIDKPDSDGVGEVLVKGDNVMLGYYKDPELTAGAIDKEGWFHTNDMAKKGTDGLYYLQGRKDNVIVGPSGENICPEEMERVLNAHAQVEESIVVGYRKQLVGLVTMKQGTAYPDNQDGLVRLQDELLAFTNQRISDKAKLTRIVIMKEPFEKTETHKIKRYKYTQFIERLFMK